MLGKNSGVTCRSLRLDILRCLVSLFLEQAFFSVFCLFPQKFLPFSTDIFCSLIYSSQFSLADWRYQSQKAKAIMISLIKTCSFPTKYSSRKHLPDNDIVIALRVLKYLLLLLFTHFYQVTGDYVFPCPSSFSFRDNIAPT